ncbi:Alpha/Beta hydrolase protein [Dichotomocladium elegans]|nr:Alpha/Beta hydrolase protein [Dichotomocladium elegans]
MYIPQKVLKQQLGLLAIGVGKAIVNSVDPHFELFDESLGETKKLGGYSLAKAYTLAVMSKLAYEEVGVIKHELEKDGFDVERSFFPMAYKNICAYIAEKGNDIYLIFRGTSPLNIQNFVTDFNIAMMDVRTPRGVSMGKVHKGFWQAMGEPNTASAEASTGGLMSSTLHLELNSASLYRTITSTVQAAGAIAKFGLSQLVHHVKDPIDNSWIGYDIDIRHHGMYAQAEEFIMKLLEEKPLPIGGFSAAQKTKKRLYVGGHSLGGALGTIFVAKMMQSESPLLRHFSGLYTFGQPKVGDAEFTCAFYPEISTYKMTFYPPDARTNEPIPVRPISFIHLSGLLNANVIRRLPQESWLRAVFRLVFPFFLNDHFPSDYCSAIRQGKLVLHGVDEGYVGDNSGFLHDEEEQIRGINMIPTTQLSFAPSVLSTTSQRYHDY